MAKLQKNQNGPKVVETELPINKICKSSVRFDSALGLEDPAFSSCYLLKTAWIELGKPEKIRIQVLRG